MSTSRNPGLGTFPGDGESDRRGWDRDLWRGRRVRLRLCAFSHIRRLGVEGLPTSTSIAPFNLAFSGLKFLCMRAAEACTDAGRVTTQAGSINTVSCI